MFTLSTLNLSYMTAYSKNKIKERKKNMSESILSKDDYKADENNSAELPFPKEDIINYYIMFLELQDQHFSGQTLRKALGTFGEDEYNLFAGQTAETDENPRESEFAFILKDGCQQGLLDDFGTPLFENLFQTAKENFAERQKNPDAIYDQLSVPVSESKVLAEKMNNEKITTFYIDYIEILFALKSDEISYEERQGSEWARDSLLQKGKAQQLFDNQNNPIHTKLYQTAKSKAEPFVKNYHI